MECEPILGIGWGKKITFLYEEKSQEQYVDFWCAEGLFLKDYSQTEAELLGIKAFLPSQGEGNAFKRDVSDSKAACWRGGVGQGNVSQADSTGHHFYFHLVW